MNATGELTMSEQVKSFWLKNLLKGKVWVLGLFVLILNVACGGGGGDDTVATTAASSAATTTTTTTDTSTTTSDSSATTTLAPVAGIKIPKELDVVRVKGEN